MPRKNIVWIASYPKSGNTWTRIFLANYLFNTDAPLPINQVRKLGVGDSVADYYKRVANGPFDPRNVGQTLALRGRVIGGIAANDADVNLVKTHLPHKTVRGIEFIPKPLTKAAIYILRNPLDMVLSYARHFDTTPERAVKSIARIDNIALGEDTLAVQPLGNWSDHVRSWTRGCVFPVLVIRYEDMQAEPGAQFTKVLQHLGVPVDQERLERAIRFSSFKELQKQESESGFVEKAKNAERFFVGGRSGHGRSELSPELVDKIERQHGDVMREFGYL